MTLMTHGQYAKTSKGQEQSIITNSDLSAFNIHEIMVTPEELRKNEKNNKQI